MPLPTNFRILDIKPNLVPKLVVVFCALLFSPYLKPHLVQNAPSTYVPQFKQNFLPSILVPHLEQKVSVSSFKKLQVGQTFLPSIRLPQDLQKVEPSTFSIPQFLHIIFVPPMYKYRNIIHHYMMYVNYFTSQYDMFNVWKRQN